MTNTGGIYLSNISIERLISLIHFLPFGAACHKQNKSFENLLFTKVLALGNPVTTLFLGHPERLSNHRMFQAVLNLNSSYGCS